MTFVLFSAQFKLKIYFCCPWQAYTVPHTIGHKGYVGKLHLLSYLQVLCEHKIEWCTVEGTVCGIEGMYQLRQIFGLSRLVLLSQGRKAC